MAFRKPFQMLNCDWGTPQKVCFWCTSRMEPNGAMAGKLIIVIFQRLKCGSMSKG